jgi:hypothetical protein
MKTLMRFIVVALVAAVLGSAPVAAADPKPLTEVDVLKLVELKIPDDVITKRVGESGVDFSADEATFGRLKKAGASEAVVSAVKKAAKPAPLSVLTLRVERNYKSWDNPLHSELTINGKSVGSFSSDTDRAIDEYLKTGWNTIVMKTTPQAGATHDNHLIFHVGPVRKAENGKRVMGPVIWSWQNGTDWKFHDGKFTHQSGPDTKDVTLTYKLYYAGLDAERRKLGAGDYVLTGDQNYDSTNTPLVATVFVNGQAVSTFLGGKRQVVITPYLRKGENVVKLVSARVANAIADNDIKCSVSGPAEYNVTRGGYEVAPVLQLDAMRGWKRHPKKGELINQVKLGEDTIEREEKFTLDHEPGKN